MSFSQYSSPRARFVATCTTCPPFARTPSHFPDRDGAEQYADRHTRMYGHGVEIEEKA